MENPGFISVVPTLIVFVLAIWTRRPIESLISGVVVGLVILHGNQFIGGFADASIRVMTDEDVAWVILVCGFMGSLIGILIRTGATGAFTCWAQKRYRNHDLGTDKLTSSVIGMWECPASFDVKTRAEWALASTYRALKPLSGSASPRLQVNLSIPSRLSLKKFDPQLLKK